MYISEPTPRARPRALPTSMQKPNAIVSSPSLVRDVLKKNLLPSKRSVAIDLTGSSEEDEAEIRIPVSSPAISMRPMRSRINNHVRS